VQHSKQKIEDLQREVQALQTEMKKLKDLEQRLQALEH